MTSEGTSDSKATATGTLNIERPPFLHEKEVQDAIRVVSQIAAGRNPFSAEPFDKLRPDQKDWVLQALCIVISAFANTNQQQTATIVPRVPSGDSTRTVAKRPLVEYLRGVERDAIVEALTDAKYNRTAAAKLLGITFRALRYRMENLGLDVGNEQDQEPQRKP